MNQVSIEIPKSVVKVCEGSTSAFLCSRRMHIVGTGRRLRHKNVETWVISQCLAVSCCDGHSAIVFLLVDKTKIREAKLCDHNQLRNIQVQT